MTEHMLLSNKSFQMHCVNCRDVSPDISHKVHSIEMKVEKDELPTLIVEYQCQRCAKITPVYYLNPEV